MQTCQIPYLKTPISSLIRCAKFEPQHPTSFAKKSVFLIMYQRHNMLYLIYIINKIISSMVSHDISPNKWYFEYFLFWYVICRMPYTHIYIWKKKGNP